MTFGTEGEIMTTTSAGIHHVTAIASDPQRNLDFYAGTLGLRLVKRTVNFDDPQTYHLYFGDDAGSPGSILTFFPWPGARRGRTGVGQTGATAFAVPEGSLGWWIARLVSHGVEHDAPTRRFGQPVVAFRDPDGLPLELVADPRAGERGTWDGGGVPAQHAIRGVHSVTLWLARTDATARVLTEALGFAHVADEGDRSRYAAGGGGPGALVDLRVVDAGLRGAGGAGTVHHVAWRAATDADEVALSRRVSAMGLQPTPVIDRNYFNSVYFREPGGVLFEIATDPPGFTADEPAESLGEALKLPPQYEPRRAQIEAVLPPIHLPGAVPAKEA
ncbi:MAG: Glyoxalase/bleomycin resistance protein/dioxygenase [Gemmatimonadetes bacterium]|nr:Glyoxalase/bleomycin resistance protein/dioxygenase [Gemmatimonadota bacterium]